MSDSLREQLLKAGFAPSPPQEKRGPRGKAALPRSGKPNSPQRERSDEVDLARAYAIRAQAEKAEREAAAREAQKQAQERKERKRRLHELLSGNAIAIPAEAEHVRHFEHAGKIRRIYVGADQLTALNRGELGVVVQAGRFVLVTREIALRVKDIAEDAVALLVDPDAPRDESEDDVPDDLMW
jgi:uncharacterized protein YaiL (DUF2058 family)